MLSGITLKIKQNTEKQTKQTSGKTNKTLANKTLKQEMYIFLKGKKLGELCGSVSLDFLVFLFNVIFRIQTHILVFSNQL